MFLFQIGNYTYQNRDRNRDRNGDQIAEKVTIAIFMLYKAKKVLEMSLNDFLPHYGPYQSMQKTK